MPRSEFDLLGMPSVLHSASLRAGHLLFAGFTALAGAVTCFVAVVCLSVEVLLTCRSARLEGRSRGSPWEVRKQA